MFRRVLTISVCLLVTAVAAQAQQAAPAQGAPPQGAPPQTSPPPAGNTGTEDTRPATSTFLGDTGLWFVPTGEVLPNRRWSASGYYTNFDYTQGFTDVSHFIGTFGYGFGRVELFGSWRLITRVDRDVDADGNSIFNSDARYGGVVNDYPLMNSAVERQPARGPAGRREVQPASESRQQPVAFALRGVVKLPTGSDTDGVGTGKADFLVDAIVSKELNRSAELTGFGGFIVRGDPDGVSLSDGFRWGVGIGGPTRRSLRAFAELHGEVNSDDQVTLSRSLVGTDGSIAPLTSDLENKTRLTAGVSWQARSGLFLGTAANWDLPVDSRDDFGYNDGGFDNFSMQFRIGYHPGVRVYVPPPPPPPPAAAAGATESAADGQGAVQPLHGRDREELHGHRRRAGSRRRHADLQVDAPRPARSRNPRGTRDALDRAEARRAPCPPPSRSTTARVARRTTRSTSR